MREIIFKAKRLDNGEWVEGDLFRNDNTNYPMTLIGSLILSRNKYTNEICIDGYGLIEVDPETVCQYTGLKDMNGKKIFEGDIIKIPDDYNEFGHNAGEIYEIYFCYGGFRLKPKYSKARGYWLEDDRTVEVIGNIFDNPEILEVTE